MAEFVIKVFGPQALLVGTRECRVQLPMGAAIVTDVLRALAEAYPALAASLPQSRLAVNFELGQPGQQVGPEDELALLGMMSGG